MEAIIMITQLLLSLSILVIVHEWGHFIMARMFHIRVEKFYLFFDFLFPVSTLLNFSLFKYKKGDTEYGIGWFPLGGYVKLAGMVDESMDKEQIQAPVQPWEFRSKPAWQRLLVMLGGIIVNVVVGILIYIGITYNLGDTYLPNDYVNQNGGIYAHALGKEIGFNTGDKVIKINDKAFVNFQDVMKPDLLLSSDAHYTVLRDGLEMDIPIPADFIEKIGQKNAVASFIGPRVPAIVGSVVEGTLASKLDLKPNDRFIEINGMPITYQDEVIEKVHQNVGKDSIFFAVERGIEKLSYRENFKGKEVIGFYPRELDANSLAHINYSIPASMKLGAERAFGVIFLQLKAFKKIFSGQLSFRASLSGPIGMAQAFGVKWDWERFWRMTGLLSMVLAFMNLLPIPALDGGYVVFLLYEMVSGREPSEKFFENAVKIGMAMLLILMVFVFYNDISKFIIN